MDDESPDSLPGFGRLLARSLERRHFSVDDLVNRSGLRRERIDQFFSEDADPSATELIRLAGALEVRPQELLEGIVWQSDEEGDAGRFWFEDSSDKSGSSPSGS